ncbi:MAG: branched-chain amino acid ABC transporter substrate-binding protein [Propionibacteriaceae bacterium]|nr:branched-chain amino acid ABC transporter substrate-binding protein [Propionibacteriaceae bacterium]
MTKHALKLAGVALVAASLALTGCGSRSPETTPTSTSTDGGSTPAENKIVKIGFIGPISGGLSALGLGMKNSAQLAVDLANKNNAIPGWTLELVAMDDEAKPDVGANAATSLAADEAVVGVVGTLNSGVAQSVIPILDAAKIVQVSPANTNPTLTQGADPANPSRPNANYFRTATTDAIQGPVAAKYLLDAGIEKVAVVHNKGTYGQGLAEAFAEAFTAGGGEVVASESFTPGTEDLSTVVTTIKQASPEVVYFGGEYANSKDTGGGARLSNQMKANGLNVPLMGGDGIFDPEYINLAGSAANGDLATSVGAPPTDLPSAASFLTEYEAAAFPEPYAAYGAMSFDAANAIIEGLKVSLASATDAKSAREATIAAVQAVDFEGASGQVKFDEFGDTVTRVITVYEVVDGAWATKQVINFEG